jgi:PIN domain nuclease of toxin-antitoxin system
VILLLDTHAFLWWRLNDRRVETVRRSITTAQSVLVSSASAWEAAIKQTLGKLRLEDSFESMVSGSGFTQLAVTFAHADRFSKLPPHHRDPFDRMLIAQARIEGLALVSADRLFDEYRIERIW